MKATVAKGDTRQRYSVMPRCLTGKTMPLEYLLFTVYRAELPAFSSRVARFQFL